MKLEGCFTAIITPFKGSGLNPEADYGAFKKLVEIQNAGGVAGIVPCGTTGESPVLNEEEHEKIIAIAVEENKGTVIAGTGSNCTREAVEMTKRAADIGAHASLQVCPYYNKPNQEGLFKHFGAVAEATGLPVVLYNIPGRSGKEIAPETMARLAREYSNVVGVKEASGKEEVWKAIREACPKEFIVISGNDGDTFKLMRDFAGKGVISVASNVIPREMQNFVELGIARKFPEMEARNKDFADFFEKLFIDTNPIMVKEAMNLLGLPAGGFRLPLCETTQENRDKMRATLQKMGLIK